MQIYIYIVWLEVVTFQSLRSGNQVPPKWFSETPKQKIKAYISQASLAATIASKLKFSRSWGQRSLFKKKSPGALEGNLSSRVDGSFAILWFNKKSCYRSCKSGALLFGFSSTTFLFTSASNISNQVLACGNLMWMNLSGETVKPSFARPTSRRQRCSRLLQ